MNQWWPRIVIVALLAVIVVVPVALSPAGKRASIGGADQSLQKLVILTPHNEQIRYEFARAFNSWRSDQGLLPIVFDWRTSGGTSDLRKSVFDQFRARIKQRRADDGIGCDLFFGGGDYEHGNLARGIDGTALTVPVQLPPGMLEQVYPQPTIGSEPLYHPQLRWVGVVLASFGIVYNRDVLQQVLDLPEPQQWQDLADPRYRNWIALADPAHAGSIAATYNIILRRRGWEEGWKVLRRIFANARYFSASASKVPVDVSAGQTAAGMCIDFYGRFQAGAVGGRRVGYIDPKYATAINADPISILRGAPQRELANQFVVWLLSRPAQNLWQLRRDTAGGPEKFELRRQPVRRDVYNDPQTDNWTDRINPYGDARPFSDDVPNYYVAVAPVAHAMAIDIHDDLRAAWGVINSEGDPAKKQAMQTLFDAMPHDLQAHADRDFMQQFMKRRDDEKQFLEDRLAWTMFFRDNYRQIVRMGKD